MYIIAKNKDYYDGVVGSVGIDKTIVYERVIDEITDDKDMLKEFRHTRNSGWHGVNRENPFLNIGYADIDSKKTKKYEKKDFFIVGFCGKLYLGWKLHYKVKVRSIETGLMVDDWKTDIVYGYDKVKEFIRDSYWRGNLKDDVEYVMSYDPIEMFREAKSPIFVHDTDAVTKYDKYHRIAGSTKLVINANLKEYEFYKVVDAFTAFTELQMFIGGVLGTGEKEIVEVEDKYKISQHGFDKWSFRREPRKKKKHG